MDIVCSDCTFYNRDICKIFLCKSYLEVTCGVSDLCTADGKQVLAGYIDGIQSTRGSSTKLEEIVQEHPLNATWSIWWRFMKKHIHHPDKECWLKLGWLLKANKMHRLWLFPYSTTYNRIIYGGYLWQWHNHSTYSYEAFARIEDTNYFNFTPTKIDTITNEWQHTSYAQWYHLQPPHWCSTVQYQWYHTPMGNLQSLPIHTRWDTTTIILPPPFSSYLASQPKYSSQYYKHIEFYPESTMYPTHQIEPLRFLPHGPHTTHCYRRWSSQRSWLLNQFCHIWGQTSGYSPGPSISFFLHESRNPEQRAEDILGRFPKTLLFFS